MMRLESAVLIRRTPEQIWTYLGDISNVPKWDRGVAKVKQTARTSSGVGLEFDTLGHPGHSHDGQDRGKMSYRVTEADPAGKCTVQLTSSTGNARFFKRAEWRFRVEAMPHGSNVICTADFTLRFPYIIFAPVFYAMKKAIRSDLENLKRVLESD